MIEKAGRVEESQRINAWLMENCGKGLPHGEVTDLPGALHALAYVLRQIEGSNSYKVTIGQCVSATTGIRWVLDYFARQALGSEGEPAESCDTCHGYGEVFGHADDCDNDSCALNGDMDSCDGKVEPCGECEDGRALWLAMEAAR